MGGHSQISQSYIERDHDYPKKPQRKRVDCMANACIGNKLHTICQALLMIFTCIQIRSSRHSYPHTQSHTLNWHCIHVWRKKKNQLKDFIIIIIAWICSVPMHTQYAQRTAHTKSTKSSSIIHTEWIMHQKCTSCTSHTAAKLSQKLLRFFFVFVQQRPPNASTNQQSTENDMPKKRIQTAATVSQDDPHNEGTREKKCKKNTLNFIKSNQMYAHRSLDRSAFGPV